MIREIARIARLAEFEDRHVGRVRPETRGGDRSARRGARREQHGNEEQTAGKEDGREELILQPADTPPQGRIHSSLIPACLISVA